MDKDELSIYLLYLHNISSRKQLANLSALSHRTVRVVYINGIGTFIKNTRTTPTTILNFKLTLWMKVLNGFNVDKDELQGYLGLS